MLVRKIGTVFVHHDCLTGFALISKRVGGNCLPPPHPRPLPVATPLTVRLLFTWLWGTYHVPQNACLVSFYFYYYMTGSLCHTNTAFIAKDR